MRRSVIVVDDFYEDPDAVRAQAVGSTYFVRNSSAYLRSTEILCNEALIATVAAAVGAPMLKIAPKYTSGGFRLSNPQTPKSLGIHVDFGADWNVIVYLSRDSGTDGGTSLWRHRASGLEVMPPLEKLAEHGYKDLEDFNTRVLDDTLDRSKWDEVLRVPARYNRLLAIRSELFHSMTADFGQSVADSRIIQVFFLNEAA